MIGVTWKLSNLAVWAYTNMPRVPGVYEVVYPVIISLPSTSPVVLWRDDMNVTKDVEPTDSTFSAMFMMTLPAYGS